MKISTTIENEPILSNVGTVSSFTIKATAKSFQVLASGLYANKIQAIIREYSCNAVDSHVAAGNTVTPFDVHLPTYLEPWFSVRDYGTGLDDVEIQNIYTSFFYSTKENSNDFIGALGLGSKSAFSYTDNFTITAVKHGIKRVFTAFINEHGVPSVALMSESESTEPTGVEIKFSVEDQYDYAKFEHEARTVFKYFKLRPVVSGNSDFDFVDPVYSEENIIPGVHLLDENQSRGYRSFAIMGNVAYPIDMPANAELGDLVDLLNHQLVIEFDIGELDIQASREGLSYIPSTAEAIKNKLQAINDILTIKFAEMVDVYTNEWEKAEFISEKIYNGIWKAPAAQYIADTGFDMIENRYGRAKTFKMNPDDLKTLYNIDVRAFTTHTDRYYRIDYLIATSSLTPDNEWDNASSSYVNNWNIQADKQSQFVINDTKTGVYERAKYHWKNKSKEHDDEALRHSRGSGHKVYVLNAYDKNKPMLTDEFFAAIRNPPEKQIYKASELMKRERTSAVSTGQSISILKLERRNNLHHQNSKDMVWRAAGTLDGKFDDAVTYYYLPLKGFQAETKSSRCDIKYLIRALMESGLVTDTIYGVRKDNLEVIKTKPNWINLDDHVIAAIHNKTYDVMATIKEQIEFNAFYKFKYVTDYSGITSDSPFLELYNEFKDVSSNSCSGSALKAYNTVCEMYKNHITATAVNLDDQIALYKTKINNIENRYPLLCELSSYHSDSNSIINYVNAIDLLMKEKENLTK